MADLYSTRLQVRLGACATCDVIAVLQKFALSARNIFSRGGVHDIFCNFPCNSTSEDARVLGNSS